MHMQGQVGRCERGGRSRAAQSHFGTHRLLQQLTGRKYSALFRISTIKI